MSWCRVSSGLRMRRIKYDSCPQSGLALAAVQWFCATFENLRSLHAKMFRACEPNWTQPILRPVGQVKSDDNKVILEDMFRACIIYRLWRVGMLLFFALWKEALKISNRQTIHFIHMTTSFKSAFWWQLNWITKLQHDFACGACMLWKLHLNCKVAISKITWSHTCKVWCIYVSFHDHSICTTSVLWQFSVLKK